MWVELFLGGMKKKGYQILNCVRQIAQITPKSKISEILSKLVLNYQICGTDSKNLYINGLSQVTPPFHFVHSMHAKLNRAHVIQGFQSEFEPFKSLCKVREDKLYFGSVHG